MPGAAPDWVADAAGLPLAFAQLREDPLLDRWVVEHIGRPARVLLIASGGCTAAYLAATTPSNTSTWWTPTRRSWP